MSFYPSQKTNFPYRFFWLQTSLPEPSNSSHIPNTSSYSRLLFLFRISSRIPLPFHSSFRLVASLQSFPFLLFLPISSIKPALSHQTGPPLSTLFKLPLVFVSPTRFPSLFHFPPPIRLPLVSSFSHPTNVLSHFLRLPCSTPTKTQVPTRSSTKFDCTNETKTEKHERRRWNEYNRATDKAKARRIEKAACK